jgi:hypothetical protein
MREANGRKYLYSLIPSDVTYRTGCLIIAAIGLTIFGIINRLNVKWNFEDVRVIIIAATSLILLTALQIYINKGYRVSFDDDAIYLRPDGIGWNFQYKPDRIMRYDEIGELYASGGNGNMSPFEFIEIQRIGWDGEERFFLSRIFLRENQLKELLHFVYTKIPDKFPQDVIDYMHAEAGWIERGQIRYESNHPDE